MITDESGYTSGFETYPSPQSNVPSGLLAPCPFCGVELYACTYDGGRTRHAHEVNGCVLDRKFVQGEAQEAAWNIRSPAPQEQMTGAARAFMDLFVVDNGEERGLSVDDIDMAELTRRFAELEAALTTEGQP